MEQRFMFDQMAKAYDAFRPGYPDALFADLAAETGLSEDDRILELGCGAGQATAGLAALGAPLLALDPGPELIRAARLRIGQAPHVAFDETTFEAWPLQPGAFKLVAAAQAWHWIDPGVRFEKAARALAPEGVLAIMGNVPMSPPADFLQAVEPLFRRYAPHLWGPPPEAWYLPSGPLPELFPTAQRFGPLVHRVYPYAVVHTPESFEGLHRSYSYYQALPAADRDALIGGMVDHIRGQDGTFRMNYEAHLYMAHRRV
ncbi:MAG TPA: methyltransferase domain-containing protein [Phenylobacterium sp.]|nr:methyltransferase domain-containing protein [Phenylobacterium sp.]